MNDFAGAVVVDAKERRNRAIEYLNRAAMIVQADPQTAYRLLCSAVTIDPSCARGWYRLAAACADLGHVEAAIAAYQRCLSLPLEARGEHGGRDTSLTAMAHMELGHRLWQVGRLDEALEIATIAVDLFSGNTDMDSEGAFFAWSSRAQIHWTMGDAPAALHDAHLGFDAKNEPRSQLALGFAHLFNRHYALGLKHLEARLPYQSPQYLNYPYPRWDGERRDDGTLFVVSEQGMGDAVSFARFIGPASRRVGKLVFAVQPELLRLMREGLTCWRNVEVMPLAENYPLADWWCPVLSLPVAMGFDDVRIKERDQGWEVVVPPMPDYAWKAPKGSNGDGLHIGIAWGGSPANGIDRWRSIDMREFLTLYECPDVQLYSLQVGERAKDLHDHGCAGLVRDLSGYIRDAADTAGLVAKLDLVICIESFVAHLVAAMGRECWVLCSANGPDWRVGLSGERPLWYRRTRLFRQARGEEWRGVFRRVVEALRERKGSGRG